MQSAEELSTPWINLDRATSPWLYKGAPVRAVVGITCALSIVGALLIILCYSLFKELRTTGGTILVHLSIMDIGVALANLVGVVVNFDRFYTMNNGQPDSKNVSTVIDILCHTQAFCGVYFIIGMCSWTASLAVYLYFHIVHSVRPKVIFWLCCVFSYLSPVPLAVWLLVKDYIGYAPYGDGGWCGLKIIDPFTRERNIFANIMGYDLLQYTTLVLIGVLYVTVHLHLWQEVSAPSLGLWSYALYYVS